VLTREESLSLRNEQIATTTRIYSGVTKNDVLVAADKLFRLADGNDFDIFHAENSVTANRRWSVYLVLAAAFGTDRWIVLADEIDNKIKVTVRVNTENAPVIPIATTGGSNVWTATTLPGIENSIQGKALYEIFFRRLDYLLGKSKEWWDCELAEKKIKEMKLEGLIEPLCNSFNINDERPDGLK
jgi:hypothetical protein